MLFTRRDVLFGAAASMALTSLPTLARAQARTRIGFVDDNLENYHANTFLAALRGPLQARGFTVVGCTALQEAPSRAWAARGQTQV